MLLVRTEISKWTALFDFITQFQETVGLRLSHFSINSASPALASVELEEDEQSEEIPARLRQSDGDDDSVGFEEALVNEDGMKRKKRKRITTRARKVIPGLSFLVIHFLLEY